MTPADTARVLAKAAAFDHRTIGRSDVAAWHEVLGDLAVDDALAAVTAHYRGTGERLMPSDVRRIVVAKRNERHDRAAITAPIGVATEDRSDEVKALVAAVVAALPTTESERVHARAVTRARAERGRPERPRPTKKAKRKPRDYPPPQSDDIAALATRYLLDGHAPAEVADRLAVSWRWCRQTAARFGRPADGHPIPEETP